MVQLTIFILQNDYLFRTTDDLDQKQIIIPMIQKTISIVHITISIVQLTIFVPQNGHLFRTNDDLYHTNSHCYNTKDDFDRTHDHFYGTDDNFFCKNGPYLWHK